jgi:hypothetical protein
MTVTVEDRTWLQDPALTVKDCERLSDDHRQRVTLNKGWMRMVDDLPMDGGTFDERRHPELEAPNRRRGYNATAEISESAASQVCREMQAVTVPVGADAETTQNCVMQNRLLDGVMQEVSFVNIAWDTYEDCQAMDIGALIWDLDVANGKWACDKADPNHVFWPLDGTRNPRVLFYEEAVPRATLIARYPDKAAAIKDLPRWAPDKVTGSDSGLGSNAKGYDTVKVVRAEAIAMGSEPGVFVLAAGSPGNSVVLSHDVSPFYDRHRIVTCRWKQARRGFGGVSLARRLEPYHTRLLRMIATIDKCMAGAVPFISADEDTMEDAKFTHLPFHKIPHPTGHQPPQIVLPQVLSPELVAQVERIYYRMAAEAGASQALASGQGPMGVTSGKGLREYVAIANQRLLKQHLLVWSPLWTDSAHVILMLGNAGYKGKSLRSRSPGADWLEEIVWKGPEKLKRDRYKVSFKLVSGLSQTVQGKFDDLQDLMSLNIGVDAGDMANALVDQVPDLQELSDRVNGPRRLAIKMVSLAIDKGIPKTPTAMMGPALNDLLRIAVERYQQSYLKESVPPENLGALRKLIRATQNLIKTQPAAQPPPMPGAPQPAPAPAPVAA